MKNNFSKFKFLFLVILYFFAQNPYARANEIKFKAAEICSHPVSLPI